MTIKFCLTCNNLVKIPYRFRWCSNICFNKYRRPLRRKIKNYSKTSTGKGRKWENFAVNLLGAKFPLNNILTNPYDILWNNYKIDVKSANLYYRKYRFGKPVDPTKQVGQWRFDRGEIYKKDLNFFMCICLRNNIPEKILLIPNKIFPKRGITITENGYKYDNYLLIFNNFKNLSSNPIS